MKKIINITAVVFSFTVITGFGFSMDDANKAIIIASITQTAASQNNKDAFYICVASKDSKVASILADKQKMAHLDDLPLQEIKQIEKVVNKCDLSHG